MGKHKETTRYNVISMRVSDSERSQLQRIASQYALNISDMMRYAMELFAEQRIGSGIGFTLH